MLGFLMLVSAIVAVPPPVSYPAEIADQFHTEDLVMVESADPCYWNPSCDVPEQAAMTWIMSVFKEEDWQSAYGVAKWESAHTFSPLIDNRQGSDASGLFQHRKRYWSKDTDAKREWKARQWLADHHQIIIEQPLDIYNGWHSTICGRLACLCWWRVDTFPFLSVRSAVFQCLCGGRNQERK